MALLSAISDGNYITVIVLCIAAVVFLVVDGALVILLHRDNSKLAKRFGLSSRDELPAPETLSSENELPAPVQNQLTENNKNNE